MFRKDSVVFVRKPETQPGMLLNVLSNKENEFLNFVRSTTLYYCNLTGFPNGQSLFTISMKIKDMSIFPNFMLDFSDLSDFLVCYNVMVGFEDRTLPLRIQKLENSNLEKRFSTLDSDNWEVTFKLLVEIAEDERSKW